MQAAIRCDMQSSSAAADIPLQGKKANRQQDKPQRQSAERRCHSIMHQTSKHQYIFADNPQVLLVH